MTIENYLEKLIELSKIDNTLTDEIKSLINEIVDFTVWNIPPTFELKFKLAGFITALVQFIDVTYGLQDNFHFQNKYDWTYNYIVELHNELKYN